jgi:hypothetical protein
MKFSHFPRNSDGSVFSALLFLKTEMKYWVVPMTAVCTFTIAKNDREHSGYNYYFVSVPPTVLN